MEEEITGQESRASMRWLWFVGGIALSLTTLCSIVLLVLLLISTTLNVYLAWTLAGYEISITRPSSVSTVMVVVTPTGELAMVPEETPTVEPTSTPIPVSTASTIEAELTTLAAIATNVAESEPASTPSFTRTVTVADTSEATSLPTPVITQTPTPAATSGTPVRALASSTNSYDLIPIEGGRESRPAEEHGDLNLELRDPQPAEYDQSLVDIPGSGIDPHAPKLSAIFDPDFVATYAVHDWDWGCNCKGDLIQDGQAVLVGIKTTPGEPVFIPQTERDIYEGKYYAVVLYASEDSLTFLYARAGSVVKGFTIHYLGLQTDPNLLALFRESQGNELPGLTLDTPVGIATDELIVAMRDNGKFLDARSKRDWWD